MVQVHHARKTPRPGRGRRLSDRGRHPPTVGRPLERIAAISPQNWPPTIARLPAVQRCGMPCHPVSAVQTGCGHPLTRLATLSRAGWPSTPAPGHYQSRAYHAQDDGLLAALAAGFRAPLSGIGYAPKVAGGNTNNKVQSAACRSPGHGEVAPRQPAEGGAEGVSEVAAEEHQHQRAGDRRHAAAQDHHREQHQAAVGQDDAVGRPGQ